MHVAKHGLVKGCISIVFCKLQYRKSNFFSPGPIVLLPLLKIRLVKRTRRVWSTSSHKYARKSRFFLGSQRFSLLLSPQDPLEIPPPRQPAGETSDQMSSISPKKKLQTGKTSLGISSGQRKEKKKTGWGKKEKLNLSFPLLGFQFDIFLLPTC